MIKGQCYIDHDIQIMILGSDDELDFVHYISIQVEYMDACVQIYFAPIHEDHLNDFIDHAEISGHGKPEDIQPQIDRWLEKHNGGKTFFTVPVKQIVQFMYDTLAHNGIGFEEFERGKDAYGRTRFCLPAIFPTSEEMINED